MIYNREDQFSLDRLINRTNAAEGTTLPPQQRGSFRVPYVSNVRVSSPGGINYIVTWTEPEGFRGKIAQYNVFVQSSANIKQPLGPISSRLSPVTITLLAPANTRLTFFVQTQLSSGLTNPPNQSPSAAITV